MIKKKFNADEIKQMAEVTKTGLIRKQKMKPPMCQRISLSVSAMINYCDQVLFLCKKIEVLTDENRDLKLGIDRAKEMLKG